MCRWMDRWWMGWMDGGMDGWMMERWMDGRWMDSRWMDGWTDAEMDGKMNLLFLSPVWKLYSGVI